MDSSQHTPLLKIAPIYKPIKNPIFKKGHSNSKFSHSVWIYGQKKDSCHHKGVRKIRLVIIQPGAFRGRMAFLVRRWTRKGPALGHRAISPTSVSHSADKRAVPSKQTTAHWLQTRWQKNKSNRKTSAPSGAASAIAAIPDSFHPPSLSLSLALILLLKVIASVLHQLGALSFFFFFFVKMIHH